MSSKRNNKRKKDSSKLLGSQNASILEFFSQTRREHAAKIKKTSKLDQDFPNFDSFATSFDQSETSNVTIEEVEGLTLNTQESVFDGALNTQNSHAWSEAISEIGDPDIAAPFVFDLDDSLNSRPATQADSVVSNFSDNSQPFPLSQNDIQFNDINDNQTFKREGSVNSVVSPILGPLDNDMILAFDDMDSVKSGFSTQEAIFLPPSSSSTANAATVKDRYLEPTTVTTASDASKLPPLSDFKFVIPTSTAKLQPVIKDIPTQITQRMKKEGLIDIALQTILKETELHEKWENDMNAQLAKYGNIAQVCKQVNSEGFLFWIHDSWIEGNLIFAWCILMSEDEIEDWISAKQAEDGQEEEEDSPHPLSSLMGPDDQDNDTEAIKSHPNEDLLLATLNRDEPSQLDNRFLFAFSLVHMKSRKYARKFIEQERVVAVWVEERNDIKITLPHFGPCVANLTSKFKADSIY